MLVFLLLFVCLTPVLSGNSWNVFCADRGSCGRPASSRIIDGRVAERNSRPFQVALYSRVGENGELGFCGGTLIDPEWVITAAHCCYHHGIRVDHVQAILGAHSLYDRYENNRRIVLVRDIVVHPDWDPLTTENDIALLRLTHAVQLSATISTVQLPFRNMTSNTFAGQGATVSGWGIATEEISFISPTLREKSMTVLNSGTCNTQYKSHLPSTAICAFHNSAAGICKGDNGGPLTTFHRATEETILIGVVSFVGSSGCSTNLPSVFTRTTLYLDWISDVTGLLIE